MLRACLALCAVLSVSACKKDDAKSPPATPSTSTPSGGSAATPDGPRRVTVEASKEGYAPDQIPGKPGEKLVLVFTRTFDASCIAQLKTPEGKLVDLPLNKPVEVAVTVPQSGQLGFACGMDMFHGAIVAQPAG